MNLLKKVYNYSYLKSYRSSKSIYKDDDLHVYYATYFMAGKIIFLSFYPLYKLEVYISNKYDVVFNGKVIYLIIAVTIIGLNYLLIERKISNILKVFKKMSEKEVKKLSTTYYVILLGIIIFNFLLWKYC